MFNHNFQFINNNFPYIVLDNFLPSENYENLNPFAEYLDAEETCNPLGVTEEAGVLEVQTDVCSHATLWQPALASSANGDELDILAYHSALYTDPPDEGYMAVMVAGETVWERWIDIPGEADVYPVVLESFPKIKKGDAIFFHVHNHGANSWKLAHIKLQR